MGNGNSHNERIAANQQELCATAKRRSEGGEGFNVHICPDCGYVEGELPQAGCCPHCGRASDPIVKWAVVNGDSNV